MGKIKDIIMNMIPSSKQTYKKTVKTSIPGKINKGALIPKAGTQQEYMNEKLNKKKFKPHSMKNFDSSKWGGEKPIKRQKFEMSKKGVISKKK